MRVYLTGFMGAGKSVVGRALAELMEVPFIDLDEEVESLAERSVEEIFAEDGEEGFRRLESVSLRRTAALTDGVIATGGGTFIEPENRRWMCDAGTVVWLRAPFDVLAARVAGDDSNHRPLFGDRRQAEALLRQRSRGYAEADIVVDAGGDLAPGSLAEAIRERLER